MSGDGVPAGAGNRGGVPTDAVPVLPLAKVTSVYEMMDDAELRHHAAQLANDHDAAFEAEFDWASAGIQLAALETEIALNWLIGLRVAAKRYPTETADLLDKVFAVRRQMKRNGV